MIILENEWDQAAGVKGQEVKQEDESQPSASQQTLPSYNESLDQQTSAGSGSVASFSRASGASVRGGLLPESTPTSPLSVSTFSSSHHSVANSARTTPVIYLFLPVEHAFNAMIVQSQDATIPLYHIFVRMNCFIPSSYITTVSRGDTEFGEEVGHFEMGISIRKPTVVFGGLEKIIDSVLVRGGSRGARTWQWKFSSDSSKHLSWTIDSPVKYCYLGTKPLKDATMLATFTPPSLAPRADGRPSPPASLKVYPDGHRLFDHIVISALILERRRLTPV
ncbi:hypothetical protein BDY19DRAFT_992336 [Irpex rosettiformis]|uniref:Uncharacterized protein n=1 Tax=Irpex rosettiformis TaxID=378272 RepID=A0ACB8U7L1_9APHY|nr:hypothetical protein BDY19DRAFT_992336 [Irpex rosettiformis]